MYLYLNRGVRDIDIAIVATPCIWNRGVQYINIAIVSIQYLVSKIYHPTGPPYPSMPLYATFTFSETGKNASTDYRKCEIHHFRLLCSFPRFGNGEKCVYKTAPKLRGYHYGSSSQAINSWLIINTIHNRDAVPSQWPSLEEGGRVWGTGEDDEGGQGEVRCLHSDRRRSTHLVPLLPAAPGNDFMDYL